MPLFYCSDDFGMELQRVRAATGPGYRFTYSDYAVKIILGSVMKKYFNMDQRVGMGMGGMMGGGGYGGAAGGTMVMSSSGGCCTIV